MIINVRGCSNKTGIIVSYLVENEKKTGYDSFTAKKVLVKDKIEMLTTIKKTLIASREVPEINANDFVSTINRIGKKNAFEISPKVLVKVINDENMQPTMATLSHTLFNDKPLPQIKAINVINDNIYFMIKMGTNYKLELIETGKIKCVIVVSSLVNLYRQVKQGGTSFKSGFKKHFISRPRSNEAIRNGYRSYNEGTIISEDVSVEPPREENIISPPEITREIRPPANNTNWYGPTLYTYSDGASTERQVIRPENLNVNMEENTITEQRQRLAEAIEGVEGENSAGNEAEENRATERQARVNRNMFTTTELPPERSDQDDEEEDRPIGLDLSSGSIERIDEGEVRPVVRNLSARERETEEEVPTIGIDEAEAGRQLLSEAERRFENIILQPFVANVTDTNEEEERIEGRIENTRIPEASAEELADALVTDEDGEEDLTTRRDTPIRTTSTESSRQTGEEIRNSFIEYLRDNQIVTLDALRENGTSIDY